MEERIPQDFIWKKIHSLAGLWITIYIIFHLLTNSQAALLIGDDGRGFIHDVNWIHDLPYLPLIEAFFIGIPIIIHAIFGIRYAMTSKSNSYGNTGKDPYLPQYGRNKAYTWQRITAWALVLLIIFHVVHMRFLEYPDIIKEGRTTLYKTRVTDDPGLRELEKRISFSLSQGESGKMIATSENFGTASLLMVRDTFKSPLMMAIYTILVLTACFHGFNGLWSFLISWGFAITVRSQKLILKISQVLMVLVALLGLAAIFLTYWVNLK